jgi:hypothetical protein
MHTYWRTTTQWQVVFDSGEPNSEPYALFNCDTQLTAAEITAFLNGGPRPDWLETEADLPQSAR